MGNYTRIDLIVGTVGVIIILVVGLVFGLVLPTKTQIPHPYDRISAVIGWTYFACWSISFYPQVYLNWKRKSVVGLSFDFELYNLIGFGCYSIFNCAFYYSKTIQEQYSKAHDGNANAVRANDVFFALHAFVLTAITIVQCFIYERGSQRLSRTSIFLSGGIGVFSMLYLLIILYDTNADSTIFNHPTMLTFLYALSYIKLGISLIKYIPQAVLNFVRKSTVGWTIWNVLLDFSGGTLSIAQLFIDSGSTHDWTAVTGDPVKFGLGFVSMVFDVIFMIQHFILYRGRNDEDFDEAKPLLPN